MQLRTDSKDTGNNLQLLAEGQIGDSPLLGPVGRRLAEIVLGYHFA